MKNIKRAINRKKKQAKGHYTKKNKRSTREKKQLLNTTKSFDVVLLTLVEKADKEQNLLLILKATSMKRKSEKKAEIKSIDEAVEVLAKKRSRIICHQAII